MAEGGESSPRYEYDAPSEVVDLKELDNAESDDMWFEQRALGADANLETPQRSDRPFLRGDLSNLPKAVVNPLVSGDVESDSGSNPSEPHTTNIVTSWGGENPAAHTRGASQPTGTTAERSPAQPRRISKRKGQTAVLAAVPSKKYRKSPEAQPRPKRSGVRRRSGLLNSKTPKRTGTVGSALGNAEPKSSEEQELERIRNLQRKVALHRRKNEASLKAALAGDPPPKKAVLSATVPQEFRFGTNTRAKASASSDGADKKVEFVATLRKPSVPGNSTKGATVPRPFNLSSGSKRNLEESSVYVPMAQQIEDFQKRTPARYHLRSRKSQRGPSPVKGDKTKLTHPHTPCLMTQQRSRPATVKSSADLEAEEVDRLQKFQFKAQELKLKILKDADVPKKPPAKEPTVPEGFELEIEKRLQERRAVKPQGGEEKQHTFKAQLVPKNILEGVVGLPEKRILLPTVPESPAFALKKRIHKEPKLDEVKQPPSIKAPKVPHFGIPFQPCLPEHHAIEVCPFSFEERERQRRALKEKNIEKPNEEFPQFKAQLLPHLDTVVLPEKVKPEPTKPEPFRLLTERRGAASSSRWEQTVKKEQKQLEEMAVFKARANTVTSKKPFEPKKENRVVTVPEAFELSTERRALERQEFEQMVSEKEAQRTWTEEERKREAEDGEKKGIARMRQEQVHKAQPIRHYKSVELKRSDVPLTIPQSPNFSGRFHL
ncbi:targeting protein for Xklp2-like [Brachionichthys hirsutus]|uniref:targeting protein for Xklp2-like n=1 Tax=Brachionichthys hirsutus TaxID=412623 RepID=UPI0036044FF8